MKKLFVIMATAVFAIGLNAQSAKPAPKAKSDSATKATPAPGTKPKAAKSTSSTAKPAPAASTKPKQ